MLQALVATTDSVDAFSLLQNMAPMSYDSSRLIDVACISFSSTDHAHLASLQARHRQTVLAQFAVCMLLYMLLNAECVPYYNLWPGALRASCNKWHASQPVS